MDASGTLQGAHPADVSRAIDTGEPFTGDSGFAGCLPDGRLVRDLLGRFPVFVDRNAGSWAFDPRQLERPWILPAGSVMAGEGISSPWNLPTPEPYADDAEAIRKLDGALSRRCEVCDGEHVAVSFSGGVDSSLLATHLTRPLYTVGFPGTTDLEQARDAARTLERSLVTEELTHDRVRDAIPVVARAIDRTNAMDMAIALSLYLVAARVAADGYEHLVLGQGADELFGGYEKVALLDHRVEANSIRAARREVLQELPTGLARDVLAVRAAGVEPIMPYLGDDVVRRSLRMREDQLVRGDTRKWTLREIAAQHLPAVLAERDKTAVQYGNGVAKELDRLARQAGYKRRMSSHVDRYVRSLLVDQ